MKVLPFLFIICSFITLYCSSEHQKSNFLNTDRLKEIDLLYILSSVQSGSHAIVTVEQQKNALELIHLKMIRTEQAGADRTKMAALEEQYAAIENYPISKETAITSKDKNSSISAPATPTNKDETCSSEIVTDPQEPSLLETVGNFVTFLWHVVKSIED